MSRCWTCGSKTSSPNFRCHGCRVVAASATIESAVRDVHGDLSVQMSEFRKEHLEALAGVSDALQSGFDGVASVLEWGFGAIEWELRQHTSVLRDIDFTLKTPAQTRAREWRDMAIELRRRGELGQAQEFFRKALAESPLDYRTYVGLATLCIETDRFDEAKELLSRSVKHAPSDGEFDYRSYSYRLLSRVHFILGETEDMLRTALLSVSYSRGYAAGWYTVAKAYSVAVGLGDEAGLTSCNEKLVLWGGHWEVAARTRNYKTVVSLALYWAVEGHTPYYYLARRERAFDAMRDTVSSVLTILLENTRGGRPWRYERIRIWMENCDARLTRIDTSIAARAAMLVSRDARSTMDELRRLTIQLRSIAEDVTFERHRNSDDLGELLALRPRAEELSEEAERLKSAFLSTLQSNFWIWTPSIPARAEDEIW